MRTLLPACALAFAAACSDGTSRFTPADVPNSPDSGLPPLDATMDARPDRPAPDVLDLTDVPPKDAPAADVACVPALSGTLRFGLDGGKVAYVDAFTLAAPLAFRAERRNVAGGDGGVSMTCETTVPGCNTADMVDVGELNAALASRDVEAAFGMAQAMPILYGYDPRPADGSVFAIERGGARVLVGDPCRVGMMEGCLNIPVGLQRLVDVLRALRDQELLRPACSAFRR